MKKRAIVFLALPFVFACNNSSNDSVKKADSANESKSDTSTSMNTTDTTNKMSTGTMSSTPGPIRQHSPVIFLITGEMPSFSLTVQCAVMRLCTG